MKPQFKLLVTACIMCIVSTLFSPSVALANNGQDKPKPNKPIWVTRSDIAKLKTEGASWEGLLEYASQDIGEELNMSDQETDDDIIMLAKALVYAKTGEAGYLTDLEDGFQKLIQLDYDGRALALGRNLPGIVIAADVIDLYKENAALDTALRVKFAELLSTFTDDGPSNLIECHRFRPNNWGHHCGASRLAIAIYLNDDDQIAEIVDIFQTATGESNSHSGFKFGDDLSWQCDPDQPKVINPINCTIDGHDVGGAQPEEMRRGCDFQWMPCDTDYNWEGMQGLVAQMHMLELQNYKASDWGDKAILRAAEWMLSPVMDDPIKGDDEWQAPLLNHYYKKDLPVAKPARPGKNIGFTDWLFNAAGDTGGPVAPPIDPEPPVEPPIVSPPQPPVVIPPVRPPHTPGPEPRPVPKPELTPPAPPSNPPAESNLCPGDFNGDKKVNRVDAEFYMANRYKPLSDCRLDIIGGNCMLDDADVSYFFTHYDGRTCN